MPQSATLESTTAPITIPAPRTEEPLDPNAWVLSLPRTDLTLALALSELPRTRAEQDKAIGGYINPHRPAGTPGVLNPAGVRMLTAWAAQGIDRAGGVLALWQATCQWRTHNRNRTWNTPAGKAFTRRFGPHRRTQHATNWAADLPTVFKPTTVRISITADTIDLIKDLGRLFPNATEHDYSGWAHTALFRMTRHDAHMLAEHFEPNQQVVPFQGGYTLACWDHTRRSQTQTVCPVDAAA